MPLSDKISKTAKTGYEVFAYSRHNKPFAYIKSGEKLTLQEAKELLEGGEQIYDANENFCFIENNQLEIYSNEVGAIIGKGGQNIKALKQATRGTIAHNIQKIEVLGLSSYTSSDLISQINHVLDPSKNSENDQHVINHHGFTYHLSERDITALSNAWQQFNTQIKNKAVISRHGSISAPDTSFHYRTKDAIFVEKALSTLGTTLDDVLSKVENKTPNRSSAYAIAELIGKVNNDEMNTLLEGCKTHQDFVSKLSNKFDLPVHLSISSGESIVPDGTVRLHSIPVKNSDMQLHVEVQANSLTAADVEKLLKTAPKLLGVRQDQDASKAAYGTVLHGSSLEIYSANPEIWKNAAGLTLAKQLAPAMQMGQQVESQKQAIFVDDGWHLKNMYLTYDLQKHEEQGRFTKKDIISANEAVEDLERYLEEKTLSHPQLLNHNGERRYFLLPDVEKENYERKIANIKSTVDQIREKTSQAEALYNTKLATLTEALQMEFIPANGERFNSFSVGIGFKTYEAGSSSKVYTENASLVLENEAQLIGQIAQLEKLAKLSALIAASSREKFEAKPSMTRFEVNGGVELNVIIPKERIKDFSMAFSAIAEKEGIAGAKIEHFADKIRIRAGTNTITDSYASTLDEALQKYQNNKAGYLADLDDFTRNYQTKQFKDEHYDYVKTLADPRKENDAKISWTSNTEEAKAHFDYLRRPEKKLIDDQFKAAIDSNAKTQLDALIAEYGANYELTTDHEITGSFNGHSKYNRTTQTKVIVPNLESLMQYAIDQDNLTMLVHLQEKHGLSPHEPSKSFALHAWEYRTSDYHDEDYGWQLGDTTEYKSFAPIEIDRARQDLEELINGINDKGYISSSYFSEKDISVKGYPAEVLHKKIAVATHLLIQSNDFPDREKGLGKLLSLSLNNHFNDLVPHLSRAMHSNEQSSHILNKNSAPLTPEAVGSILQNYDVASNEGAAQLASTVQNYVRNSNFEEAFSILEKITDQKQLKILTHNGTLSILAQHLDDDDKYDAVLAKLTAETDVLQKKWDAAKEAGAPSSVILWHTQGAETNVGKGWVISPDGECIAPDIRHRTGKKEIKYDRGDDIWLQPGADDLVISHYKANSAAEHEFDVIWEPENLTAAQIATAERIQNEIHESWKDVSGLSSGIPSPSIGYGWGLQGAEQTNTLPAADASAQITGQDNEEVVDMAAMLSQLQGHFRK